MTVVCEYCKRKITAKVHMELAGKIINELICMSCLINGIFAICNLRYFYNDGFDFEQDILAIKSLTPHVIGTQKMPSQRIKDFETRRKKTSDSLIVLSEMQYKKIRGL